MPFLVAAVVLVGVLCLLNLTLTFAMLRRLREHQAELGRLSGGMPPPFGDDLVGRPVPRFHAAAVDGASVTRDSLLGRPRLVGFFSAGCQPCHEQAPEFGKWLSEQGGDSSEGVAVVTDSGPEADELVALLRDKATVVTGSDAFAVADAFAVSGFPTFLQVDAEGVVTACEASMRSLARHEAGPARA